MCLSEDHLFQSTSSVTPLLGAVVFLFVLYLLSSSSQEQRKEPPGPRPLPLLGNLLQLDLPNLHTCLCHLSKKYGPVFTIHLGYKKVVVLAGYKTVKQALVNYAEEFGDREVTPIFYDWNKGHGLIFSNGEPWKEMRRFALTNLRDFGMGKKMSEENIIQECNHLIDTIEKHEGKAFDSAEAVNYAASNVISTIVYGDRFQYNDPVFRAMVNRDNEAVRLSGSAAIQVYNVFPWLGPWIKTWRLMMKMIEDNREEIRRIIRGLKETLNPQIPRGFIDSFLMRKKGLEDSGTMDSHYHDDNLVHSVVDLFGAGTETTANTIRWGLLFLAKYPHVQDQVHEELIRVTGNRQVLVEDRKNLPYTDAVIHEIQRLANIAPISIPHVTRQDVTFQGYFIKKGTPVIPLLASVLNDETEWESPHTFNPNNFLDQDGRFVKRDAFMPFSAGRRACVGESLAKMEVFLFLTSLLKRFRFTPPPGVTEDELDLTPVVGFTLNPSPHQLCAVSRL